MFLISDEAVCGVYCAVLSHLHKVAAGSAVGQRERNEGGARRCAAAVATILATFLHTAVVMGLRTISIQRSVVASSYISSETRGCLDCPLTWPPRPYPRITGPPACLSPRPPTGRPTPPSPRSRPCCRTRQTGLRRELVSSSGGHAAGNRKGETENAVTVQ